MLVVRHVVILNPAASVRAERYAVVEGKLPVISGRRHRRSAGKDHDGRVALRATHDGTTNQRENGRRGMLSAMPAARFGNSGKKGKKTSSGLGFHAMSPC
jgi:hypothetical protein